MRGLEACCPPLSSLPFLIALHKSNKSNVNYERKHKGMFFSFFSFSSERENKLLRLKKSLLLKKKYHYKIKFNNMWSI